MNRSERRKYRTEIPNIVDDSALSVYAFRLYAHIKRVAGDKGICNQGARTLAKVCKMALGRTTKAKQELVNAGLISIEKVKTPRGMRDYISVIDIWTENYARYTKQLASDSASVHQMNKSVHQSAFEGSPNERKKEQKQERTIEESKQITPSTKNQFSLSDRQWLVTLSKDSKYKDIDVYQAFNNFIKWYKERARKPTRSLFERWLEREEKPLTLEANPYYIDPSDPKEQQRRREALKGIKIE